MNNCILMAEIIQSPQLRYTSDNQTALSEFTVQFPATRATDPPSQMKVVGWGNLAQEIQERYKEGDRVLLIGRININTIDRPEGFKEKRAEMTAQRIQALDAASLNEAFTASPETPMAPPMSASAPAAAASAPPSRPTPSPTAPVTPTTPVTPAAPAEEPDYDDIPF
ncbi:MAG: single-stranded DNA-binding protein [Cyanobacteria bacterium P01_A01_bin.123]